MRFSVIMPVNLTPYTFGNFKSASFPEYKFIRAIDSFRKQVFSDAELIIISDGCSIAEYFYNTFCLYDNKQDRAHNLCRKIILTEGKK